MRARFAALLKRREAGLSLVEVMVATLLTTIVVFAAMNVLDNVTKNERGQTVRHTAMLEIRQAMTRITKDLRQATWIDRDNSNHTKLVMRTLASGAEVAVTYELIGPVNGVYRLDRTLDPDLGGPATSSTQSIITNMVLGTTPLGTPDPPICYSYYSAGMPSECLDLAPPNDHPPDELTAIRITFAKDPEHNPGEPITLATDVQLRNL